MLKLIVVAMVGMLALSAAPAVAVPVPLEVLAVGSCVTFGGGSEVYPVAATLKFIPFEFEGPIADDGFVQTLENVGHYGLANIGADILIPASLNAEEVAGGLSLPVVNAKVGVPLRAGVAYIGGTGYRGFLRIPWISSGTDPATALALIPVRGRLDLLAQSESGLSLATLIPADAGESFALSWAGEAAMAVYSTGF